MSLILDLIIVAIVAICVLISAKKGFVRTIVSAVGFVLAVFLAFSLSTPIASLISKEFVRPAIEEKTFSVLSGVAGNAFSETTEDIWNELPDFVVNAAASAGVTEDSLGQSIKESTATTAEGLATDLTDKIFLPIVENLVKTIVTFVLFLLLIILVSLLSKILNKLFSGAVFGKFNRTLGGILGAVKGSAFAVIFCLLVSMLVGLSENGFLSITKDTIDSTFILSKVLDIFSF